MLAQTFEERSYKANLLLAISTALAAGMTNIIGAMACYAFTTNVTGHAASFAQHMVKANWFEMLIVIIWLTMFLLGAAIAHFLIHTFKTKGNYIAHAIPILIEMIIMIGIGIYGMWLHDETEIETISITAVLLFTMGMQNSTVSLITGKRIKTTHLTGLLTDLGAELSEWLHIKKPKSNTLKHSLQLRLAILAFYIIGAIIGGIIFLEISFASFYIIAFILFFIIIYDLLKNKLIKSKDKINIL